MSVLAGLRETMRSVPQTLGRADTRGYVPELDGLRCLAILFVLVWHASLRAARYIDHLDAAGAHLRSFYSFFPHGEVGVILFFFISGFVVSQPFVGRPRATWAIGQFYKRRLVRIYPPYLVTMIACFVVLAVLGHKPTDANAFRDATIPLRESFAASLVYMHGIVFNEPSPLNPPMWSLEIEVLFYALLPLLMLIYCALSERRLRIGLMCGAIAAAIFATSFLVAAMNADLRLRWGLFFHAYLFLMGIVVADLFGDPTKHERRRSLAFDGVFVGGLAVMVVIGLMMTHNDARMPSGGYALLIEALTVGSILLIFYGALRGRTASALLSLGWIRLIGTMCYSLYLTHIVVMTAVGEMLARRFHSTDVALIYIIYLVVLVGISLASGTLFYLCVERPFARLIVRPKRARPDVRLVGAVGASPQSR